MSEQLHLNPEKTNCRVIAVIPARLQSRRFPNKLLSPIDDRPMLWHVWCLANRATLVDEVYIATDSTELAKIARDWGAGVLMTSTACRNGTERVASVVNDLGGEIIINIQGDQPKLPSQVIDTLVCHWSRTQSDVVTPVCRIQSTSELADKNVVKVVRDNAGNALYFSRSPIPCMRDVESDEWITQQSFWRHVGVYLYSRDALLKYIVLPVSDLEDCEMLEQLRLLASGLKIATVEVPHVAGSVDTIADFERLTSTDGTTRGQCV